MHNLGLIDTPSGAFQYLRINGEGVISGFYSENNGIPLFDTKVGENGAKLFNLSGINGISVYQSGGLIYISSSGISGGMGGGSGVIFNITGGSNLNDGQTYSFVGGGGVSIILNGNSIMFSGDISGGSGVNSPYTVLSSGNPSDSSFIFTKFLSDVDALPTSPDPWDDEFNVSGASWVWTQPDVITGTISNGYLTLVRGGSAVPHTYFHKPVPAGSSWSVTAKLDILYTEENSAANGGLCLINTSANTKILHGYKIYNSDPNFIVARWNAPSTFSTNQKIIRFYESEFYERITYDGTNVIFSVSRDGINFMTVYSEAVSAHLSVLENIGFLVGANLGRYICLKCDWIRKTS